MLELKGITKDYPAGDGVVHALKGIDLKFRSSEFVSILGPSGCGKTTMLNIIGGLDQYTDGDLIINGVSTKKYKDRDWDTYRNHSIGFVFQSYNLIPHQSVLQNVELALTLSGVSHAERRARAEEALKKVGLGDQLKKKPGEMSGGQMQRVAIARAIVNDPDIILADEPTGALDTETSVQVMELLKEIAKDKLIIMVTHNPELAQRYSTRIIRVLDGEIQGDSHPLSEEECRLEEEKSAAAEAENRRKKKPSMSFPTAFSLSLKNLMTKKGRTLLTAFAGSIGIIGIALIASISNGLTNYINEIQENALSSYPITIESTTMDMNDLIGAFSGGHSSEEEHGQDAVYSKTALYDMMNAFNSLESTENDLGAFKTYLEDQLADPDSELSKAVTGVQYTYDANLMVYTENPEGEIIHSDLTELMQSLWADYMGIDSSVISSMTSSSSMYSLMSSSGSSSTALWEEMLAGENGEIINDVLYGQYDLVYGSWPSAYNEVVLVLDEKNELNDMTLYALGLVPQEDIEEIMQAAANQETIDTTVKSWSYEEICSKEYHVILNSDCYVLDEETGTYHDLRETETGLKYLYDNGLKLKVVGIIRQNPDADVTMLNGSIAYTSLLTDYIVEHSAASDAASAQKASPDTDIFTGLPFASGDSLSDEEKAEDFLAWAQKQTVEKQAEIYVQTMSMPSDEEITQMVNETMSSYTMDELKEQMIQAAVEQTGMKETQIKAYVNAMSDSELRKTMRDAIEQQIRAEYSEEAGSALDDLSDEEKSERLQQKLEESTTEELAELYDSVMEFSDSTYEENMEKLEVVDESDPASVSLYASTFANKDVITDAIADYNEGVDDLEKLTYTDYIGLFLSSMTSIINAISYVLIAFVGISLVVSSIMIGVITLISVQERTKEIGILRAMGASKRDVSSMFNAETIIIGFASGVIGDLVTILLCYPVNALIHSLTGLTALKASLPVEVGVALLIISVLLTLIAGIIPSRSAAKKDPVVALRSE